MRTFDDSCALCGLPLRYGDFSSVVSGMTFRFCCMGCRQVFHMLMEASDGPDPCTFKETELFKKCQEMGIVPRTELDLKEISKPQPSSHPDLHSGSERGGNAVLPLNLRVYQMWCPACAWVIEQTLMRRRGVFDVSCNFSTDRVCCKYSPVVTSPDQIIGTMERLGYKAALPGEGLESKERKREFIRFAVSAFLTANVMMFSFALYSGFFTELSQGAIRILSWPIFLMASIVFFYGGQNIYQRAWAGIRSAGFSMEALITVGSLAAYIYSTVNLVSGSIHLYYDTASLLITLVLLGKMLEGRAKAEVQEGLANFFSLRPTKARICSEDYPEGRYGSVEGLRKGDVFRTDEGEVFPADGLVVAGGGSVDESSLSGEPLPIFKKIGDRVKSGTKVIRGTFKVNAELVGEASILGQMIMIMERALGRKTRLEGKTDQAMQWFVPAILVLALGTGLICLLFGISLDKALIRAVTVLVISCPCTLGIAIPLARVAGIALAGQRGILVQDFSSFEKAGQVDTFVLDKTGTVTVGMWSLEKIIPFEPFSEEQVLAMAASLESGSDHYIAAEIRRRAEEGRIQTVKVDEIRSFDNGISGHIGKEEVKIGSKAFLAKEFQPSGLADHLGGGDEPERSFILMAFGGQPCAIFVFGDKIREGATEAIDSLRTIGQRISLISGDDGRTTREIARRLGIRDAYGGKLPQDKVSFISDLQRQGHRVAMVGDGINDAPALAQSDLAIAVHSGSLLGKETADITLMRSDPRQILDFMLLARRVNGKIHQNLIWSFVYNVISIPLAMGGLLSPLIAVCAMLLSSLSVIGNTLLLMRSPPWSFQGSRPQRHADWHRQIVGRPFQRLGLTLLGRSRKDPY